MAYAALAFATALVLPMVSNAQPGIFEGSGDVGAVLHKGTVEYDADAMSYKVTGSGENVWGTADGFFFVWKKISGDVSISADIAFATKTGEEHKKAMLMFRQTLDADAAYADIAAHAVGLTSLQSRAPKAPLPTKCRPMSPPFPSACSSPSAAAISICRSRAKARRRISPVRP